MSDERKHPEIKAVQSNKGHFIMLSIERVYCDGSSTGFLTFDNRFTTEDDVARFQQTKFFKKIFKLCNTK